LLQGIGIAVNECDPATGRQKDFDAAEPDAGGSTGDQCNLIAKLLGGHGLGSFQNAPAVPLRRR
jgi:hypothetical protein